MEIKNTEFDDSPISRGDVLAMLNCLSAKLKETFRDNSETIAGKLLDVPRHPEILIDQDDDNIYAAALCPGMTADMMNVVTDGTRLFIETKPVENEDDIKSKDKPFLWYHVDNFVYAGEYLLPEGVIAEKATVEMANGVLYILMPKEKKKKPEYISFLSYPNED